MKKETREFWEAFLQGALVSIVIVLLTLTGFELATAEEAVENYIEVAKWEQDVAANWDNDGWIVKMFKRCDLMAVIDKKDKTKAARKCKVQKKTLAEIAYMRAELDDVSENIQGLTEDLQGLTEHFK